MLDDKKFATVQTAYAGLFLMLVLGHRYSQISEKNLVQENQRRQTKTEEAYIENQLLKKKLGIDFDNEILDPKKISTVNSREDLIVIITLIVTGTLITGALGLLHPEKRAENMVSASSYTLIAVGALLGIRDVVAHCRQHGCSSLFKRPQKPRTTKLTDIPTLQNQLNQCIADVINMKTEFMTLAAQNDGNKKKRDHREERITTILDDLRVGILKLENIILTTQIAADSAYNFVKEHTPESDNATLDEIDSALNNVRRVTAELVSAGNSYRELLAAMDRNYRKPENRQTMDQQLDQMTDFARNVMHSATDIDTRAQNIEAARVRGPATVIEMDSPQQAPNPDDAGEDTPLIRHSRMI